MIIEVFISLHYLKNYIVIIKFFIKRRIFSKETLLST